LVGWGWDGIVADCFAAGSVTGTSEIGGLVGYNHRYGDFALINNCYSTGWITATGSNFGGLVGRNSGSVFNSYWNVDTSGKTTSAGGTGLQTAQMKTRSTFTNDGWDFIGETANGTDDIWRLCEDLVHYPRLAWEFPSFDFVCPDGVDFFDYSIFTSHWGQGYCGLSNNCDGTDLDLLGTVDIYDLRILVDNWLTVVELIYPPSQTSTPDPPDGAVDVNVISYLSWTAANFATSYDVYFSTSSPPAFHGNQTDTVLDPCTMVSDTTYYWRIDSVNNKLGTSTGKVWSFTTVSYKATNPSPSNGATIGNLDSDLSWTAGPVALSHDVYFGTDNPPPFIKNQISTTYDPGTMTSLTQYYWRIDELNPSGKTTGDVWSFSTMTPPPPPPP
jgi:hypothetical protein